ncbi:ankyrin repeats (3 copies) domain-containing protein [Pochonia chlamydosporia 170]|uniref:Ankyrin repeats (3 copies) domain-containing protein n=1 Tax=Pochonia chlamydosporia 170 TaxID=1380566 RepID=A0A179FLZ6_METCM|nr:ankyrin repeats (3 copies) domain-containing protein [Pochonia chlamydosporia 170]OAQ66337.1 ankyrin repeats (3 copies) domain-containing protein [Pochonia chlamydosporia 170]
MDKLNDTPGTDSQPKVKPSFVEEFRLSSFDANNNQEQLILEVERLLKDKDMDVNDVDENGMDALMWSIGTESIELVNLLLRKGADPTRACKYGWTAASMALGIQCQEILERLITADKSNLEWKNDEGRSLLLHAVYLKYTYEAELLLEHGADIYSKDKYGKTAFDLAEGNEKMLKLLNKHKGDKGI